MLGDGLALASVTPNSVSRQIHVGAMGWKVLVVNGAVIKLRLRATDPTAVGKQTEPKIRSRGVAIAALDEALLSGHHCLDEGEIAAIGQMRAIPYDQRHFSTFSGRRVAVLFYHG